MAGSIQKFSDEQIIEALISTNGMVHFAADRVGCSHTTIYNRAKTNPEVAQCLSHESGKVDDLAESQLLKAIERGEQWAIVFRLSTKGKSRGFTTRTETELTGRDGGPMEMQHSGTVSNEQSLTAADIAFAQSLVRSARARGDGEGDRGIHTNGDSQPVDNECDPGHNGNA